MADSGSSVSLSWEDQDRKPMLLYRMVNGVVFFHFPNDQEQLSVSEKMGNKIKNLACANRATGS
ncbi:MAG: hypothetical protein AAF632_12760 [Bacteroidota bacterium]